MKVVLLFFLLFTTLIAKDRPKIALVLSGGGARGGAHVGVLKVLEKNRVPIDLIVGTSMGSFVGGLYASGKTPQEIDDLLSKTDWREYITADFKRQEIPMRKKELDYIFQGKVGLGVNADNEIVLPTGVLKREPLLMKFVEETQNVRDIKDFDNLSIAYRAVATDVRNGEAVVLKSGSLARAMYASSAIPGGFQPIKIDGKDLIDGGVSNNFPIKVARDMGADIIIAVDVSENFDKNLNVDSYFVIMGQLVNIMMRKNANESILTLKDDDILLTPELEGFSGLDADKYPAIIKRGTEVTEKNTKLLSKLSLSKDAYALYRKKHRAKHVYVEPVLDEIRIVNNTYLHDDSIRKRISAKVGQQLNEAKLREELMHLYQLTVFDSVNYKILEENGRKILEVKVEPSWDNHGEIRFAIGLEDDFQGHSAYSLKLGYTMFGINSFGAEWRNFVEIGRRKKLYTEFFQPLDVMQNFYIRPSLNFEETVDIFPLDTLYGFQLHGNSELFYNRTGGTFAFGMHANRMFELETGLSFFKDNVKLDLFKISTKYRAKPVYISAKVDNLDNVNFPKVGVKAAIVWTKELKSLGSEYDYEQFDVNIEKPLNFYSNNLTLYLKYGNTYKKGSGDAKYRLYGTYTLGGLFNLSGYAPYSFTNDNMALGVLKYRYQIKDGGFFGVLNTPLYAGFSLEGGGVWGYKENISRDVIHRSATVYAAADTVLGPFYFAYGISNEGESSLYLYLGEKF